MLQVTRINPGTFAQHRPLACEYLDAEIKFLHDLSFVRVDHATLYPRLAQDPNGGGRGQTLFALQASRKASYGPGRLETFCRWGGTLNKHELVLTQSLDPKGSSVVA